MRQRPRWFAILAIFLAIAALLVPATGGSHATGILVPLAPLFGFVVLCAVCVRDEPLDDAFVASPPLPSRAPPQQLSTD